MSVTVPASPPVSPDSALHPATAARKPRVWMFPTFVVGLLGMQIVICLIGVYLAISSKSFAVESDYYSKALHWDDEQAAERASAALGWKTDLTISQAPDLQGNRELVLSVTDRAGQPVAAADTELIFFHHARASDVHHATLRDLGAGHYAAALPLARAGTWEFRIAIGRGKERFLLRELETIGKNKSQKE